MTPIDLLAVVLRTPGALAPIVWGDPGIGKSARLRSLCSSLSMHLETVVAAIHDPTDFSGLPVPSLDAGSVRMIPPNWAKRLSEATGPAVLFLDEVDKSPPTVQAALLRIVLEGVVGDLTLPSTVRCVAAANPPDDACGGWDLSTPLANRFVHLRWSAPTEIEWADWLLDRGLETTVPDLDPTGFDAALPTAKALVAAFHRSNPGRLTEPTSKIVGRFPLAFATPRTWECLTRLLASCRALGLDDAVLPLAEATVGPAVAVEFCSWLSTVDLPDPEDLLRDPSSWTPDPTRPDAVFATLTAVVSAVVGPVASRRPDRIDRWRSAWSVLARAVPLGSDIVTVAALDLAKPTNRPAGSFLPEEAMRVVKSLKGVAIEAGLAGVARTRSGRNRTVTGPATR